MMKYLISGLALALSMHITPVLAQTEPAHDTQVAAGSSPQADAKAVNFSPLYIILSDAMGALKANDQSKTRADIRALQDEFRQMHLDGRIAEVQAVQTALTAVQQTANDDSLSALSAALYTLDKQLNPVDYTDKRKIFAKKVMPAFDEFSRVLKATDAADPASITAARSAYDKFNRIWVSNERVVRNSSRGHYGRIETAMALVRVAIESTPVNHAEIDKQLMMLKTELDAFNAGKTAIAPKAYDDANYALADGVQLLKDGLAAFRQGDASAGQAALTTFIGRWTLIEGDVSTRNPALYTRIESQLPLIIANGSDSTQQDKLSQLIDDLTAIDPAAAYSAVDAMLILLREGLEALLIVMALLSALSAAGQAAAKKWVYAGVAGGLAASIAAAVMLQRFFPAISAGSSRELMEGVIGVMAVVFMLGIGAWLHSKSSVKSWNAFIKRHMGQALTTGGFVGLFGLAFLSVFREGAETILFYVGILPNISTANFLLGIGAALLILAIVAVVMLKTSARLPIPKLFAVLTWLIYALGFKMLGISVAALQLTGHFSRTVVAGVLALPWAGFYPTIETMAAQGLYLLIVMLIVLYQRKQTAQASC